MISLLRRLKREVEHASARQSLRANRRALAASGVFQRERLSEKLWDCHIGPSGEMTVGGIAVTALAKEFGTPLHVIHTDCLRRNYNDFLRAFAGTTARVSLGTSYKTNPVPFVLETLHECGSLAEVISHFELWLALELGIPGSRIVFNGPGKTHESLELAVENGVRLINVDSHEELEELEAICARRGHRQSIGLRLTTSVGWESQFGFAIESGSAMRGFAAAASSGHLDPVGIHLHLGTGISTTRTYVQGVSECLALGREVKRALGVSLSKMDFGGGFGVSTTLPRGRWARILEEMGSPVEVPLPGSKPAPSDYARELVPMINAYFADVAAPDPEVVFEPGRAITASAQTLLLTVLRVKRQDRRTPDVILDGGRNLTMPLAWEFHEVHPANRMLEDALTSQNLYGPLCHPHDVIALNKSLPRLERGDVVAVMDAGAYFIPNQTNFSNPRPGIVAVENGSARLVRTPESFADIVRLDVRA
jgi:diaminopimelate decarboxylase